MTWWLTRGGRRCDEDVQIIETLRATGLDFAKPEAMSPQNIAKPTQIEFYGDS